MGKRAEVDPLSRRSWGQVATPSFVTDRASLHRAALLISPVDFALWVDASVALATTLNLAGNRKESGVSTKSNALCVTQIIAA